MAQGSSIVEDPYKSQITIMSSCPCNTQDATNEMHQPVSPHIHELSSSIEVTHEGVDYMQLKQMNISPTAHHQNRPPMHDIPSMDLEDTELEKKNLKTVIDNLHNMNILMPSKPLIPPLGHSNANINEIQGEAANKNQKHNLSFNENVGPNRRCSFGCVGEFGLNYNNNNNGSDINPKLISVLGPTATSALLSSSPVRRRSTDANYEDDYTAVLRKISPVPNVSPATTPSSCNPNRTFVNAPSDNVKNTIISSDDTQSMATNDKRIDSKARVAPLSRSSSKYSNPVDTPTIVSKVHLRKKFNKTLSIKNEEDEADISDDNSNYVKESSQGALHAPYFEPHSLSPIHQSSASSSSLSFEYPENDINESDVEDQVELKTKDSRDNDLFYDSSFSKVPSKIPNSKDEQPLAGLVPKSPQSHDATIFIPGPKDASHVSETAKCHDNLQETNPSVNVAVQPTVCDHCIKPEPQIILKNSENLHSTSETNLQKNVTVLSLKLNGRESVANTVTANETKNSQEYRSSLMSKNVQFNDMDTHATVNNRNEDCSSVSVFYLVTTVLGNFLLYRCFPKQQQHAPSPPSSIRRRSISRPPPDTAMLRPSSCHDAPSVTTNTTTTSRSNDPSTTEHLTETNVYTSVSSRLYSNIEYHLANHSITTAFEDMSGPTNTTLSTDAQEKISTLSTMSSTGRPAPISTFPYLRRSSHNSIRTVLQYMSRRNSTAYILLLITFLPMLLLAFVLDATVVVCTLLLKVKHLP